MPLGVPTVVSAAVMLLVFSRAGYLNGLLLAAADGLALIGVHWRFEPVGWTVAGGLADRSSRWPSPIPGRCCPWSP